MVIYAIFLNQPLHIEYKNSIQAKAEGRELKVLFIPKHNVLGFLVTHLPCLRIQIVLAVSLGIKPKSKNL